MRRWRAVVAAAAIAAAAAFSLLPVPALSVRGRDGVLFYAVPVPPGERFALTWVHTVSRRPVTETFRVAPDGRLELLEMTYDAYGANLPAGPEGGTTFHIEGDRWRVTGYRVALNRLDLAVGPFGHELTTAGRTWDMAAAAGPDRLLQIRHERLPRSLIYFLEVRQWRRTRRPN